MTVFTGPAWCLLKEHCVEAMRSMPHTYVGTRLWRFPQPLCYCSGPLAWPWGTRVDVGWPCCLIGRTQGSFHHSTLKSCSQFTLPERFCKALPRGFGPPSCVGTWRVYWDSKCYPSTAFPRGNSVSQIAMHPQVQPPPARPQAVPAAFVMKYPALNRLRPYHR